MTAHDILTATAWGIATFGLVWLVRPGGWIDRRTPTWFANETHQPRREGD